jgi:hypothetical protein
MFDVELLDTTTSNTAQATITMNYVASTPGCKAKEDDNGCSAGGAPAALPLAALMLLTAAAAVTRRAPSV